MARCGIIAMQLLNLHHLHEYSNLNYIYDINCMPKPGNRHQLELNSNAISGTWSGLHGDGDDPDFVHVSDADRSGQRAMRYLANVSAHTSAISVPLPKVDSYWRCYVNIGRRRLRVHVVLGERIMEWII